MGWIGRTALSGNDTQNASHKRHVLPTPLGKRSSDGPSPNHTAGARAFPGTPSITSWADKPNITLTRWKSSFSSSLEQFRVQSLVFPNPTSLYDDRHFQTTTFTNGSSQYLQNALKRVLLTHADSAKFPSGFCKQCALLFKPAGRGVTLALPSGVGKNKPLLRRWPRTEAATFSTTNWRVSFEHLFPCFSLGCMLQIAHVLLFNASSSYISFYCLFVSKPSVL